MARAVNHMPARRGAALLLTVALLAAALFAATDSFAQSDAPASQPGTSARDAAAHDAAAPEQLRKLLDAAHIDTSKLAESDLAAVIPGEHKGERTAPLADPTRPPPTPAPVAAPAAASAAPKGNRLTSVMIGPRRRVAVLDGHEVREGTMVGAARVVRIQRDAVVLQTGSTQERISLYPNVVRKARPQPSSAPVRTHRAKHHE